MGYYLAKFTVTNSYNNLSREETIELLKKEWLYGLELAVKGVRIGGFFDQPAGIVYGFYEADSEEALAPLLAEYPTERGGFATCEISEVLLTQDGSIGLRTPFKLAWTYLQMWFFKLFMNSSLVDGMIAKRLPPAAPSALPMAA